MANLQQADFIGEVVATLTRFRQDNEDWQERTKEYLEDLLQDTMRFSIQEAKRQILLEVNDRLTPAITNTVRAILSEMLEEDGYAGTPTKRLIAAKIADVTDSDMSVIVSPSTESTTRRSYAEIRQLRSAHPDMRIKAFCSKFEIQEQAYYRAMRSR